MKDGSGCIHVDSSMLGLLLKNTIILLQWNEKKGEGIQKKGMKFC